MTADGRGEDELRIGVVLEALTGQDISHLAVVASGQAPDGIADVDGAQVIATLSGGGCGFISLGRYYPAGDAVWAEAFGTLGSERCDVIDPAEGERPARGTTPPGGELRGVRGRRAVCGGHGRRRGRGADRRRAGHRRGAGSRMNAKPALRVGIIGYGVMADLLGGWPEAPWTPGFREGAAVQAVCDAMETSADSGRWVKIGEVTSDVRKLKGA